MSTAPVTPNPSYTIAPAQELHKISQYIKAHERLIVLVVCLAVGIHFYSAALGFLERRDQRLSDVAHATLAAQVTENAATAQANAAIAATNTAAQAKYEQLVAQLAETNKALATAQAARDKATATQQATDRTLPAPELAARWTTLLNIPAESVQPAPGGFTVTPTGAQETVVTLEQVPQLQADLKDEQTLAANQSTQIVSLSELNTGLHTQITGLDHQIDGLNAQIVDDKKVYDRDTALLKAQARKSKLKWFAGGYVAGLATRGIVKIFTGI